MVSEKLRIARAIAKSSSAREKALLKLRPAPMLSKEQSVLHEMFGGSPPIWGTGNSLPVINNSLTNGGGLTNIDPDRETASMFGM